MIELLVVVCQLGGLLFFTGAVVGLLRFPDFYTRVHATSKGDTLSTMLVLLGLALYHLQGFSADSVLLCVKILFVLVFVFVTSPTGAHALIDAGYAIGLRPWIRAHEEKLQAKSANKADKQE